MELLLHILSDYTAQIVLLGAFILGLTSGCLGSFTVLRQQSLLGDAISHATLPGVCLAFLLTQSKSPLVLLLGAGIAGWIGTLFIMLITHNTRLKSDSALGIVLSVFFGFGLVLLTIVQKLPTATKAGLDKFLFGNAATLLKEDIIIMAILSFIVLSILALLWKEFKLVVFDQDFAHSLGFNTLYLSILLTSMIVVSIVIGLQTVGVVLMSAMLVAPAAAARQWTDKLGTMVLIASFFGILSGMAGVITSSMIIHVPTGPMIVIYISFFVLFSLLFAPNRGLVWDWLRSYQQREKIRTTAMLKNLLLFSEISEDPYHAHDIAALDAIGRGTMKKTMMELSKKEWVQEFPGNRWALTPLGLAEAKRLTEEYERQLNVPSS